MPRVVTAVCLALLFSCSDLEDPTEVPLESIISLARVESQTLRGDGVSRTTIEATVPPDVDPAKRNITFRATAGGWVGGDAMMTIVVPADNNGRARATYIVPAASGPVTITAKVSDFSTTLELPIQPAQPDSLVGDTSSAFVTQNGATKAVITVLAQRATGKASSGIPIVFTAHQTVNGVTKSVGRFSGIDGMRLDATGKATATFAADSGDVEKQPVVIRAATTNDAGAPVIFEITLRVD